MVEVVYAANVERLLTLGRPDPEEDHNSRRYAELGLCGADKDELLRMAQDDRLHTAPWETDPAAFAPIHAVRALCEFRVVEAIEPVLGLLDAYPDDEWTHEAVAHLFPAFGGDAIAPLAAWMRDPRHDQYGRSVAVEALGVIARRYPEFRAECIAQLASQLELLRTEREFNGFVVSALLDAEGVEAAGVIRRAYDVGLVDESICGDWADVEYELGLRDGPPERRRMHEWSNEPVAGSALDFVREFTAEERKALKKQRRKQADAAARVKQKTKLAKRQQKRNRK